jgi:DNA-binding NarL/FixJ family response regulator
MGELTAERQRTFESITLRRAQVLRELANDWTEREIAERLGISPSTVRSHLEAVKDILGLPSNRDVARFWRAERECWVRFMARESGAEQN